MLHRFLTIGRRLAKHALGRTTSPYLNSNRGGPLEAVRDYRYRTPQDLRGPTQTSLNVLLTGSCFLEELESSVQAAGHGTRFILLNHMSELPPIDDVELKSYDIQIAQIPTRALIPDLALTRLRYNDLSSFEALFAHSCERLDLLLDAILGYHRIHGGPVLVCNLIRPQQNPLGRLLPKDDLRNMVCYVDRLNQRLYGRLSGLSNVHILDVDEISANHGRRYHQDDHLWTITHGSVISDYDAAFDRDRLQGPTALRDLYVLRTADFLDAVVAEVEASVRTLQRTASVKLVVMDLDDTLWRGIAAEAGGMGEIEGWPLGLCEALGLLRERGLLLAILSRNDETRISELWPTYFQGRLELDDFVMRRINWRPKAQNMAEILLGTNILPSNVLFVDDNPVERAAMTAAFPDIRTLGAEPYLLRRVLLWAPETQVAAISTEASARTQTTRANIDRKADQGVMPREEFLASLNLKVRSFQVRLGSVELWRSIELLNRTNQFNTTGRRWRPDELEAFIRTNGHLLAFEVTDRYSAYGLTALTLYKANEIVQVVMSCRVFGMDVEQAVLSAVCASIAEQGNDAVRGMIVETPANKPCRSLFADAGFTWDGEAWLGTSGLKPEIPSHIDFRRK